MIKKSYYSPFIRNVWKLHEINKSSYAHHTKNMKWKIQQKCTLCIYFKFVLIYYIIIPVVCCLGITPTIEVKISGYIVLFFCTKLSLTPPFYQWLYYYNDMNINVIVTLCISINYLLSKYKLLYYRILLKW